MNDRRLRFAIPSSSKSIDWDAVDADVRAVVFDIGGCRLGVAVGDWRRELRIVADSPSGIACDQPLTLVFRPRRVDEATSENEHLTEFDCSTHEDGRFPVS